MCSAINSSRSSDSRQQACGDLRRLADPMRPSVLIRLYPTRWRRRYEDEFNALLQEERWSTRLVIDVAVGAIQARLSPYPASTPSARRGPLVRTKLDTVAAPAIISVAAIIAIARFIAIDASSHSASDTLRPWSIQVAVIAAVAVVAIVGLRRWARPRRRS